MANRFGDFDSIVADFFTDFGFTTIYTKYSAGIPDDEEGTITEVKQEIEIHAIKMELPRPSNGAAADSGTQILEGDQILYVRPTEKVDEFASILIVNPTSDKVLIQGSQWKVVTVKEHNPSSTDNILYELYIRK